MEKEREQPNSEVFCRYYGYVKKSFVKVRGEPL